jgi:hypothetical protein
MKCTSLIFIILPIRAHIQMYTEVLQLVRLMSMFEGLSHHKIKTVGLTRISISPVNVRNYA